MSNQISYNFNSYFRIQLYFLIANIILGLHLDGRTKSGNNGTDLVSPLQDSIEHVGGLRDAEDKLGEILELLAISSSLML